MTLEEAYNNLIEYYDGEDDSHEYIQESWAVFKQLQNTSSNKKYVATEQALTPKSDEPERKCGKFTNCPYKDNECYTHPCFV